MRVILRILAVVTLAASGMAFIASTASATVLCRVEPVMGHDCLENEVYGGGTELTATLKSSLTFKTTGGATLVECTGSALAFKSTSEGGAESTVGASVTAASFFGCNSALEAQSLPWEGATIAWTSGTNEGTMAVSSLRLKSTFFGISCVYGGLSSSTLKGSALLISASVSKASGSGLCPSTLIAHGEYQVAQEPEGELFVAQKPRGIKFCADAKCATEYKFPGESELRSKVTKDEVFFKFDYEKKATAAGCAVSELRVPFTTPNSPVIATTSKLEVQDCLPKTIAAFFFTENYRLELKPLPKTMGNGTATMRATETSGNPYIVITEPGVFVCEYETEKIDMSFTAGSPALLQATAILDDVTKGGSAGKCGASLTMKATYEVTQPKPLYIF